MYTCSVELRVKRSNHSCMLQLSQLKTLYARQRALQIKINGSSEIPHEDLLSQGELYLPSPFLPLIVPKKKPQLLI